MLQCLNFVRNLPIVYGRYAIKLDVNNDSYTDGDMAFKSLKLAINSMLLLSSANAFALPFNSFDPRSMAMGGAGVAVGDAASAPVLNPALLSVTRYSDDFSLVLPTVGIRVADPDGLVNSLDKFLSGNYIDSLTTSVSALNAAITAADFAAIATNATSVATGINTLSNQLLTLNDKPVTMDGGLTAVIGIPNKKFGIAFFANRTISSGGLFLYKDAATISALSTQTTCLAAAAAANDVAAVALCGIPDFNTNTLQSTITLRGVMMTEIGISVSRELRINKHNIALGITPKVVQMQLFDIPMGLNSPNLSNFNANDYRSDFNMINFDLGLAQNFRNGWRTGLVIKNVIPYFPGYKRATVAGGIPIETGESLRLIPQSRIGVSHTNPWSTVALDMDLYRNNPAGLERYTQYIALGGELNAWNFAQLRAGYRVDLVDSSRNIVSIGMGLSPFGVHTDIAIAGNETEIGASLQLGFRF